MYWLYNPYYWYYYYPPIPPDPIYLMNTLMQAIMYPYYYYISIEMYKSLLELWKKTIENITKSFEAKT